MSRRSKAATILGLGVATLSLLLVAGDCQTAPSTPESAQTERVVVVYVTATPTGTPPHSTPAPTATTTPTQTPRPTRTPTPVIHNGPSWRQSLGNRRPLRCRTGRADRRQRDRRSEPDNGRRRAGDSAPRGISPGNTRFAGNAHGARHACPRVDGHTTPHGDRNVDRDVSPNPNRAAWSDHCATVDLRSQRS